MDKRVIGAVIAVPALIVAVIAMVVLVKPTPEQEAAEIKKMLAWQNGSYDFDLAQKKVDRIAAFLRENPTDPRGQELVDQFFSSSQEAAGGSASQRGELMVFAAQLRPICKEHGLEVDFSRAYYFSKLDPADKFYDQAKQEAENFMAVTEGPRHQPHKASMMISASSDREWQNEILDIARKTVTEPEDKAAVELLQQSLDHVGQAWKLTGTYWPSGEPFSTADLKEPTYLLLYQKGAFDKMTFVNTTIFLSVKPGPPIEASQSIVYIPEIAEGQMKLFEDALKAGVRFIVASPTSPANQLTGKYSRITFAFDANGIHTGNFSLL